MSDSDRPAAIHIPDGALRVVSTDTGEEREIYVVPIQPKRNEIQDWVTVYQHRLMELAQVLNGPELRVMVLILAVTELGNTFSISTRAVAARLDMSHSLAARAVRGLIQHDFIRRWTDPNDQNRRLYMLSPALAWKGPHRSWKKAGVTFLDKLKWEQAQRERIQEVAAKRRSRMKVVPGGKGAEGENANLGTSRTVLEESSFWQELEEMFGEGERKRGREDGYT